jgi:hypothetical protein
MEVHIKLQNESSLRSDSSNVSGAAYKHSTGRMHKQIDSGNRGR